jgi:hypothetical protein
MSDEHGTTDLAAAEADLRRWLAGLVDDTVTDPRARETIQSRITPTPQPRPRSFRSQPLRSRRRLAVALAAAIVLVIAAVIVAGRTPRRGEVETVDDPTSTTGPEQTTTTSTPPATPTHALTLETSTYTLEAYYSPDMDEGWVGVDVWLVSGAVPADGDEGFEFDRPRNPAPPSDGTCVDAGGTRVLDYLYNPRSVFASGLVGPGISRLDVVTDNGARTPAVIGNQAPHHDVRAWLAAIPDDDVDRIEGFDATGDLVSSAIPTYGDDPAQSC